MEESFSKHACPHCSGRVEFPEAWAGECIECPHCGLPFELPRREAAPGNAATREPPLTATDLAAAFQGSVQRRFASAPYQAALLAVSGIMILLPALYIAVIAALGWSLFRFALGWFAGFERFTGGARLPLLSAPLYVAGLFLGFLILFFLVKPVFAPPRRRATPLALTPPAEPLLYAFVHMVCDTLGAKHPVRVAVDCRLNAAAGFKPGLASFVRGDLVVTVGLPLVASLNTRQFAGVLAHEVAHFNQRLGMRASHVVRAVNAWLARVACERDAWDERLESWASGNGGWTAGVVGGIARLGVFLSRTLLQGFMVVGHATSCVLLRQMELDADRCQAEVAGSSEFERTLLRVEALRHAARDTYRQMRARWNVQRRLPANLAVALAEAERALPTETRERIEQDNEQTETHFFATHPPRGVRVQRAKATNAPGLFHLEAPATVLFADFEVLARQATLLHYEDNLGLRRDQIELEP